MNRILITSVTHNLMYVGINTEFTRHISKLVEELKRDYDWFIEVKAFGGTIQGVLNSDNKELAEEVGQDIMYVDTNSTIMISDTDVKRMDMFNHIGEYSHPDFVAPGRLLDKLVRVESAGIYDFEKGGFTII